MLELLPLIFGTALNIILYMMCKDKPGYKPWKRIFWECEAIIILLTVVLFVIGVFL